MTDVVVNLSSEKVFYTVQGEGPLSGIPSVFIRLTGCNLRCSWKKPDGEIVKCDTPHTSFEPEVYKVTASEIVKEVLKHNCRHVVITGGEPFLFNELYYLIGLLKAHGKHISIETNGTKFHETPADLIVISQKLKSSGSLKEFEFMHETKRFNLESLKNFFTKNNSIFKFVINEERDVAEIKKIIKQLRRETKVPIKDLCAKTYLMPMGINEQDLADKMKMIFELCKKYKVRYSDRLHVRAYGHQKGV